MNHLPPSVPATTAPRCRLQLLGTARLVDGTTVTSLGRRLAPLVALVAILGPTSRAAIAAWLYPDAEADTGRRNLRQLLHKQRDVLCRLIDQNGEMLCLRSDVAVDALRRSADGEAPPPQLAGRPGKPDSWPALLPPAPLLASVRFADLVDFQHWLDDQRAQRLADWCETLKTQAGADEQAGHLDLALRRVQALVAAAPTAEAAHRWLMRLQHARGNRSAALAAFDHCEQVLKDELGTRPDAETLKLLETIERAQSVPLPLPDFVPTAVLRPPQLVGREAPWRLLSSAWNARDIIVVAGDAGIGKTRLIGDFVSSRTSTSAGAVAPAVVLVSARPADERLPNALLTRLLRGLLAHIRVLEPGIRQELARLLPEMGEAPPYAPVATRFVAALEALVDAAVETGLDAIVVDDLHFADDASIELLGHLVAHRSGTAAPRWLFAFRTDELGVGARRLLDTLSSAASVRTVVLEPFARGEVAAFVESLGIEGLQAQVWADTLHARSGGNPLYLLETIKSLLTRGPDQPPPTPESTGLQVVPSVLALIERRIGRLSSDAVRLARCAAVAGESFSTTLSSRVLGVRPLDLADAWRELETAQVLSDGAFVHDLIHQAVLASVPAPIARELHAEIAAFLVAAREAPARIALHAKAGGLTELAATQWQAAGHAATRLGRRLEASVFHSQAAEAHAQLGRHNDAFEARREHAEARADHRGDAVADDLIERLIGSASDDKQRVAAWQLRANLLSRRGDHRAAAEAGTQALVAAASLDDAALHLRLACTTAHAFVMLGAPDRAYATLQPCELWVRVDGSEEQRMRFAGSIAQVLDGLGRLEDSETQYGVALSLARVHAPGDVSNLLSNLGAVHHKRGTIAKAAILARDAAHLCAALNAEERTTDLSTMHFQLAKYLCDLGHYREAIALAQNLVAEFGSLQAVYWRRSAEMLLAIAFTHLGQFARVDSLIDDSSEPLPANLSPIAWGLRAALPRSSEPASDTRGDLIALAGAALESGPRGPWHAATLWRARGLPQVEAAALLDDAIAWYRSSGRHGSLLGAHTRAIEIARRAGARDKAVEHARAAIDLAAEHTAPLFYGGEVWLQAAHAFGDIGEDAAARAAVSSGLDVLRATLTEVAPEFRASFLERNPTNAALRALANRIGPALDR